MNADAGLAALVLERLRRRGESLATAESCTGGGILESLTAIAGSSEVVWGGVVAYHNDAKTSLLDVSAALIARDGAVSAGVAKAMAWGVHAWVAWYTVDGKGDAEKFLLAGKRQSVRAQTVRIALEGLLHRAEALSCA